MDKVWTRAEVRRCLVRWDPDEFRMWQMDRELYRIECELDWLRKPALRRQRVLQVIWQQRDTRERLAREILESRPKATALHLAVCLGCSERTIRRLAAWRLRAVVDEDDTSL